MPKRRHAALKSATEIANTIPGEKRLTQLAQLPRSVENGGLRRDRKATPEAVSRMWATANSSPTPAEC